MLKFIAFSLLGSLLISCSASLSLPVPEPKPGKAIIKGGTVSIAVISAQYSYVAGVDGVLFKSWSGAKDIAPGKHRFLFAASHAAGLKSFAKMDLKIEEGGKYLVEASNWTDPTATYIVYRMPGKTEVARTSVPMVAVSEYQAGQTLRERFHADGWRDQE